MTDVKVKVGRWVVALATNLALALMPLTPISAHDSSHSGKPNISPDENNTEVCHMDLDGEFDLIKMQLDMAFDHFENNDGHVLAIDGDCEAAE